MQIQNPLLCAVSLALIFSTGTAMAEKTSIANPPPTPALILEAKKNPNGWVYVIQGNYGPNDAVPLRQSPGLGKSIPPET